MCREVPKVHLTLVLTLVRLILSYMEVRNKRRNPLSVD